MAELPEASAEYKTAQALLSTLAEWYITQVELQPASERVWFTRLVVVALSQYSATLAVDVGLPEPSFVKICELSFKEAYDKAPKFG